MTLKNNKAGSKAEAIAGTAQLIRQLYGAGRAREALVIAEHALREARGEAVYADLYNLAGACALHARNLPLAESYFRQASRCQPEHAEAVCNLAVVLMQTGQLEEAAAMLARAAALRPERLNLLGDRISLLMQLGHHAEAEAACRQLLARSTRHPEVHFALGVALMRQGRSAEAEPAFRQVLDLQPDYPEAVLSLGGVLQERKAYAEAEQALLHAAELAPQNVDVLNHLGNLYREVQRYDEAELRLRQAVALQPRHEISWSNLCSLLAKMRRDDEADLALRQSFEQLYGPAEAGDPSHFLFYRHQFLYQHPHRIPDNIAVLEQLRALHPEDANILSVLAYLKSEVADWAGLENLEAQILAGLATPSAGGLDPFTFLRLREATPAQQLQVARQHALASVGTELAQPALVTRRPEPRQRLRIGYLSSDFHKHATYYLLIGTLEQHDDSRVEVVLFSYGIDPEDSERQRLLAAGVAFRNLRALTDLEAARVIAAADIDILVDLKGYTKGHRPGITALRPAPVIVNWLGFPGTLGHPRLADYLIGDAVVSPPAQQAHFSETLALLPHCYQPNDNSRAIAATPSRAAAGLPETGFVFCSFNQTYKLHPHTFAFWCRLLQAVPGSVLWLWQPRHKAGIANLLAAAASHCIAPERLVFARSLPHAEHLGRLALADLALDTFPVGSHTTASDALWAGVPLLTRPGETFVSRVAASLLHAVGLPELVLDSDEALLAKAVALATDPEQMAAVRARLAQRAHSPLFDTLQFTQALESLYRRIWAQECAGERQPIAMTGAEDSLEKD